MKRPRTAWGRVAVIGAAAIAAAGTGMLFEYIRTQFHPTVTDTQTPSRKGPRLDAKEREQRIVAPGKGSSKSRLPGAQTKAPDIIAAPPVLKLPDIAPDASTIRKYDIPTINEASVCLPRKKFRFSNIGKGKQKKRTKRAYIENMIQRAKFSAVVAMENPDGSLKFLAGVNAEKKRFPASITKLMTLYLSAEQLQKGAWKETDLLTFSEPALEMGRRKQSSNVAAYRAITGNTWRVRDFLYGLMMKSSNEAAVELGLKLESDPVRLGQIMTQKARQIGMLNTVFKNASGWTDYEQYTTPVDLVVLLHQFNQKFPEYKHYLGKKTWTVTINGKAATFNNNIQHIRDGWIGRVKIDEAKSGTLSMSGLNMIVSGMYGGRRVYMLVMGGANRGGRNDCMMQMTRFLPKRP